MENINLPKWSGCGIIQIIMDFYDYLLLIADEVSAMEDYK